MKLPVKQLALILAGVMTLYGLAMYASGPALSLRVIESLASMSGLLALLLCLASYLLRGWRWRLWMAHFGRDLPPVQGLRLYLAGYTFTPTPGNVGEALRGMLLSRQPLSAGQSLAIYGAERLADLVCLLLLCLPGVVWLLQGSLLLHQSGLVIGVLALLVCGLAVAIGLKRHQGSLMARWPWLSQAWQCLTQRSWVCLSLTLLAWGAQGVAVWLICQENRLPVALSQASGFYALAMVGGAASMLPAGLGSMEAILTTLLMALGSDLGSATLVTVGVRLLTLWLAVAVGAMALLYSAAFAKDLSLTSFSLHEPS